MKATLAAALSFMLIATTALAAPGHSEQQAFGVPAPQGQGRPVRIDLTDNAYSIKKLNVKAGETVRFVLVNNGTLLHEFNLNTAAEHAEHRPMMAMMMQHGMITPEKVVSTKMPMPDGTVMTHKEPNSVFVEPGKKAEVSWKFTTPGVFEISCNIPGHAESGMVTPVTVTR